MIRPAAAAALALALTLTAAACSDRGHPADDRPRAPQPTPVTRRDRADHWADHWVDHWVDYWADLGAGHRLRHGP